MKIFFTSKRTSSLQRKEIKQICLLKNTFWKYNLKNQLLWFNRNIKSNDIHNMIKFREKILGYTCLRKRTFLLNNKKEKYLLFDTLIISKKLRGKKISKLLMSFNNNIIIKNKKISFLFCKKDLISFYKNNGWKKIKSKLIKVIDHNKYVYKVMKLNDFYDLNYKAKKLQFTLTSKIICQKYFLKKLKIKNQK